MLEFKNCKLVIDLEAQSPLIHFQTDSAHSRTTTLRASEVKPKLDRFLLKKLQVLNNYKDIQEIKSNHELFFTDPEHNALNYTMKIENKNRNPTIIDLNPRNNKSESYDLYYGNMGKNGEEIKKGVISDPRVTIFCFIPELRKIIQDNIIEFFLISNFGTMQNKGFGSFLPLDCGYNNGLIEEQINYIADCLLNDAINSIEEKRDRIKTCYCMKFPEIENKSINGKKQYFPEFFREIKTFYSIMKSGQNYHGYARSYIYEYMHEKNIDNEKAWMKQKHISPVVGRKPTASGRIQNNNPKYVRAMLGTGMTLSYIKKQGNSRDKVSITISSNSDIKRVSSPIYFKIIKNIVFIIAKDIPKEVYNQSFTFTNNLWNKRGCLNTPKEFDIDDFLDKYVIYYNGKLREKVSNIGKRVQVVKICQSLSE